MAMFYLEGGGDSLKCPKCKAEYDVRWDTEYGDPIEGEHRAVCPACVNVINFECLVEVKYIVNK